MIRPLLPADVPRAQAVQWAAMSELEHRQGRTPHELTDAMLARGLARIAHLQQTDPESAFVADVDGVTVGCALALVRDGMWFLSLLMVDPAFQGKGIGRGLLEAALTTATDRSWILSTDDPAAMRRYQRAGFVLHPTYTATGPVDRALLAAVPDVRPGSYDDGLLDDVAHAVRGARLHADSRFFAERDWPLFVVPGRGYVVCRTGGVVQLAATDEDAARQLLVTALAEAGDEVEVDWLGADQQWAIDTCLDARLSLGPGASICLRGQAPMSPYLPSGALG